MFQIFWLASCHGGHNIVSYVPHCRMHEQSARNDEYRSDLASAEEFNKEPFLGGRGFLTNNRPLEHAVYQNNRS